MNKVEILEKLIAHYEMCIKEMPVAWDWKDYINENNVELGICFCGLMRFDIHKINISWTFKHNEASDLYWFKTPSRAETKSEAIELLQKRLDIMKQEILIPE